jgi:hypothetical protein
MLDKAHQDLEEETMKWKKISTELPSTYGEVKQPYNVDGLLFLMSGYSLSCQMYNYIP